MSRGSSHRQHSSRNLPNVNGMIAARSTALSGRPQALLAVSIIGREARGRLLDERPNILGPPYACATQLHRLWRPSSGDPGVPRRRSYWNDSSGSTLSISDEIP